MILLKRFFCGLLMLTGSTAFAHIGDHSEFSEIGTQLHHLGLPLSLIAIVFAAVVIMRSQPSTGRVKDDGPSGH